MAQDGIRIAIVLGSVQPSSSTAKAAALVADEFRRQPRVAVDIVDPRDYALRPPGEDGGDPDGLQDVIAAATGVVLATPEYHGSFSSVMKLVIENLDYPSALGGKPVALLGVAAGRIGAIKSLEHLSSVCSHVGAIVLPGPVSVAHVRSVFDDDGRIVDPAVERRLRRLATNLVDYLRDRHCPETSEEQLAREGTG
jgi:FMN reductase